MDAFDPRHNSMMFMTVGNHMHCFDGERSWTFVPGQGRVDGYVPDPDYVEPEVLLDGCAAPDGVKRKLFKFKVMHCGWECDDDGWVVEMKDGSKALVMSSHNHLYVAEPADLEKKIAEYEKVLGASRKALKLLSRPPE